MIVQLGFKAAQPSDLQYRPRPARATTEVARRRVSRTGVLPAIPRVGFRETLILSTSGVGKSAGSPKGAVARTLGQTRPQTKFWIGRQSEARSATRGPSVVVAPAPRQRPRGGPRSWLRPVFLGPPPPPPPLPRRSPREVVETMLGEERPKGEAAVAARRQQLHKDLVQRLCYARTRPRAQRSVWRSDRAGGRSGGRSDGQAVGPAEGRAVVQPGGGRREVGCSPAAGGSAGSQAAGRSSMVFLRGVGGEGTEEWGGRRGKEYVPGAANEICRAPD